MSLTREQKLEILCKAGMMLRKELKKSQEKFGAEVRMRAYLCPIEAIDHFDKVIESLKDKEEKNVPNNNP